MPPKETPKVPNPVAAVGLPDTPDDETAAPAEETPQPPADEKERAAGR